MLGRSIKRYLKQPGGKLLLLGLALLAANLWMLAWLHVLPMPDEGDLPGRSPKDVVERQAVP